MKAIEKISNDAKSPIGGCSGLKLFVLLKSLSAWEIKSFEKFVASPFCNPNAKVSQLLPVVLKEYPAFDEKKL